MVPTQQQSADGISEIVLWTADRERVLRFYRSLPGDHFASSPLMKYSQTVVLYDGNDTSYGRSKQPQLRSRKYQTRMAEERKLSQRKPIKTTFISDAELPVHYVNIVNVRAGLEEFFITLGTVMPPEITDLTDLEGIDSLNAHTLLRFAVSRSVMKQMLEVMQAIYDQQTSQLEMLHTVQEEDQEHE